jgi:enediyne biosynthesis protein E4
MGARLGAVLGGLLAAATPCTACSVGLQASPPPTDALPDVEPPDAGRQDGGAGGLLRFTDVTAEAGAEYWHWMLDPETDDCDLGLTRCGLRWFTGGAAVGDFDGDGWPDLYVTRLDDRDILYRNLGNGAFEDVTLAAGLGAVVPSNGAAWADVNDDGHLDLYVTTVLHHRSYLYVSQGDGTFVEAAEARGVALEDGALHAMFGPAFGDYDLDGWVDLQTTEWDGLTPSTATHARLFRNRGIEAPGHFIDASDAGASLANEPLPIFAFTAAFTDLDGDLWPDLVVVGDFTTTRVFWNERDGSFTEGTHDLGQGIPSDENGMGLAIGDIDGDGLLDWFVTSIYDDRFPCPSCEWGTSGESALPQRGKSTLF